MGCGRIVRILFIPELIPTSGREVIVLHARMGESPCCVDLLFPHLKDVQVDGVSEDQDGVVVSARTWTTHAVCHQCGTPTARRHGRYRRRLPISQQVAGQS